MVDITIKSDLIKALESTRDAEFRSGGSEIAVQCPRCYHLHHSIFI